MVLNRGYQHALGYGTHLNRRHEVYGRYAMSEACVTLLVKSLEHGLSLACAAPRTVLVFGAEWTATAHR